MNNSTLRRALLNGGAALQVLAVAGAAATLVAPTAVMAQDYTRGNIVGTVVDSSGNPVSGAEVTVKSNEQGFESTTTTDANGVFRVTALPTGTYSVVVKSGGEVVVDDRRAAVSAGQSASYKYTAGSAGADTGNEIVVTGARIQTNDFGATQTGIVLDVQQIIESVPVPRSQSGLILLAPGTNSGDTGFTDCSDCASIGGASIAENSYYVNGLNTTNFRTFVGNNTVPFEFYRTIDVKTGGFAPEFGRALGGVTSTVVKSGSNNFEAGAVVIYSPNALAEDSPNTFTNTTGTVKQLNQQDYRNRVEANFYASGAIIKDRVFFYGLYNPRWTKQGDTSVIGGFRFDAQSNSPFFGGKLDAVITDGHRLEATFFRDKRTTITQYTKVDPTTFALGKAEGTEKQTDGGNNYILQYTGKFTDWLTLSGAYGVNNYARKDVVIGFPSPIVQSTLNGVVQTVSGIPVAPISGDDRRKVYRADADVYVNLLGTHHFRAGYDREDLSASENTFYTGDYIYRYTPAYIRTRTYLNTGNFESRQTAFYLQDSWTLLNERLNLQLGVRNDRFENFSVEGKKYLDIKNQWAPRLGASFDVFGDKLTKINAFWGRYYLPVATNTNIRLAGAETFYEQRWAYPVARGATTPGGAPINAAVGSNGAPVLGALTAANTLNCPNFGPGAGQRCRTVFSDGIAGPTDTLVQAGLNPMYSEEKIFGITHRMDDWTFGVRYINRRLKETLEDVAIDAAVNKYCAAQGLNCNTSSGSPIWSGFHQYVLANPGSDITVRLDGLATAPGTTDVVTLKAADLGYPKPVRKYDAVEFTAGKRFNGLFGFDFSYTWQKLRGNYEGSVKSDNNQDDAGLTQDFDQPGLSDGALGTLANERKHTFKLFGSVKPIDWLTIGANVTVQSPRNFSCIGVHPTDAFAAGYGAASFYCRNPLGNGGSAASTLVARGSAFKGNWNKNVDLGFQFDLPQELGKSNIRIDVFNVFNSKSKLDFVEFGENDDTSLRSDYKLVTGYQAPRGVRFTWALRFGGN